MKIQFSSQNEGYKEVIEMLKENHPEYKTEVQQDIGYSSESSSALVAKIGPDFFEGKTPHELYQKIVDHFFKIPNCFIG